MNETTTPMEEVRVVFLGDDFRGAEKVIEYLKNIDVLRAQMKSKEFAGFDAILYNGMTDLLVHFWNLCQSNVSAPLHRLFLTGHTIYVVMPGGGDDRERYWLNEIEWYAPRSLVLSIYNQTDRVLQRETDPESFTRVCSALQQRIRLDVHIGDEDAFRSEFWEQLYDYILEAPKWNTAVPASWHRLRHQLCSMRDDRNCSCISGEEYRRLCGIYGIRDAKEIRDVTLWLQEQGTCFGGTNELVVLNSRWLIKGAKAILSPISIDLEMGLVFREMLLDKDERSIKQILMSPKSFRRHEKEAILSALCNVDVCIPVYDAYLFIPSRAPHKTEGEAEALRKDPQTIELRMHWNGSPEIILHRLMARMHQEIDWDMRTCSGAMVVHMGGKSRTLILARGDELRFYVRCVQPDENYLPTLERIMQVLGDLCRKQRHRLPELMAVFKTEDREELYAFDRLMSEMKNGSGAVYSPAARKIIPVSHILRLPGEQEDMERERLRQTVYAACNQMQSERKMWTASENERSIYLLDRLRHAGYQVHEQSMMGSSAAGRAAGLLICMDNGQPWAVLESLRAGSQRDWNSHLREWNSHLDWIFARCGDTEAPLAFFISYAECDAEDYDRLWEEYLTHMREYRPRYARSMNNLLELPNQWEDSAYVRAVQCTYDIGGRAVSLTHFLVHMGDKGLRTQAQIYKYEQELRQRMSELSQMQSRLSEERHAREKAMQDFVDARTQLERTEEQIQRYSEENEELRRQNDVFRQQVSALQDQGERQTLEVHRQSEAQLAERQKLESLAVEHDRMRAQVEEMRVKNESLEDRLLQCMHDMETAREAEKTANRAAEKWAQESARASNLVAELEDQRQAALTGEREAWEAYRSSEAQLAEQNARIHELQLELETANARLAAAREQQAAPAVPEAEEPDDNSAATEYRVIIMGDSEAGKSQILHRLKHPGRDPREFAGDVTPGIDIISRYYPIGGQSVRVNFWDFGGQEILHSMHRMFLAKNTMYVIVLNTRNDNQDEQARFWLRYVDVYAPGAPVLLVMNKIDQNDNARLNMPALLREFGDRARILEVLSISARDWPQEHFQKVFVNRLLNHIGAVLLQANTFSEQELRIRDQMRAQRDKHRVIDMDDFCDICGNAGLTEPEDQKNLADRFHTTGVFVYFGTRTQMLLDPQWITGAVYQILKRRKELAENGFVDCEKIEDLLVSSSDKVYRRAHVRFVLDILRRFGLSFSYQQKIPGVAGSRDLEFMPMLCQREEPAEITALIDEEETIQMQIVFTYLPSGLIYQMISGFSEDLETANVWLYGAAFRNKDGCRAVVRRERNRLFLYVQGENRVLARSYMDRFMAWIRNEVIGESFTTRITQVLIGYPVKGKVEFFDYDRLTLAKEKNLNYVISKERKEAVAVQDILDQTDRSGERPMQEMLRLVLQGCEELQMNQTYWFQTNGDKTPKMDENARNRLLRLVLSQSFFVKDQPQGGESATGASPGELDLLVGQDKDTHLAILEALNISGDNSDSKKRWTEHLLRMMERYNKKGLRNLVLVSYLNCPENHFKDVADAYYSLLNQTESEHYNGTPRKCDTVLLPRCPDRIQVIRADYTGGAGEVAVYHFLVHIPQYTVKTAEKK